MQLTALVPFVTLALTLAVNAAPAVDPIYARSDSLGEFDELYTRDLFEPKLYTRGTAALIEKGAQKAAPAMKKAKEAGSKWWKKHRSKSGNHAKSGESEKHAEPPKSGAGEHSSAKLELGKSAIDGGAQVGAAALGGGGGDAAAGAAAATRRSQQNVHKQPPKSEPKQHQPHKHEEEHKQGGAKHEEPKPEEKTKEAAGKPKSKITVTHEQKHASVNAIKDLSVAALTGKAPDAATDDAAADADTMAGTGATSALSGSTLRRAVEELEARSFFDWEDYDA